MKRVISLIKKVTSKSILFYGFWSFIIILIGQLPILLHIWHAPANRYYPYLDTIAPSDYYYPAIIRYGMGQDWLTKIPYTTIPHQGSLIQILFVLLGKLAVVFHTGPNEIFALSRVFGGLVLLLSVVHFIHSNFDKSKQKRAFLFIIFAQPLPFYLDITKEFYGKWTWHFGEAARRISIMPPHYTIGKGLTILSLSFYFQFEKKRKRNDLIRAIICIIVGGIIYPAPVFILLFSLVLAKTVEMIFHYFQTKQRKIQITRSFVLYCFCFILPLLLLKHELLKGFPWNMWNKVELGWNDPKMHFEAEYARMMGIFLFFLPVAFLHFIKKRNKIFFDLFLWVWCFSGFLLFPFANFLQLGKFRFAEGMQIVPISILAFYSYELFIDKIKQSHLRISKIVSIVLLGIIFSNFLIFTLGSLYSSTMELWKPWGNIYIINYEMDALNAISKVAKDGEIVMADSYSSNYIPVFARVRTILGFSDLYEKFWDFQLEEASIQSILKQTASVKEAQEYISRKNIGYIYYQKYMYGNSPLYPSLLDIIFSNQYYDVYKVRSI